MHFFPKFSFEILSFHLSNRQFKGTMQKGTTKRNKNENIWLYIKHTHNRCQQIVFSSFLNCESVTMLCCKCIERKKSEFQLEIVVFVIRKRNNFIYWKYINWTGYFGIERLASLHQICNSHKVSKVSNIENWMHFDCDCETKLLQIK